MSNIPTQCAKSSACYEAWEPNIPHNRERIPCYMEYLALNLELVLGLHPDNTAAWFCGKQAWSCPMHNFNKSHNFVVHVQWQQMPIPLIPNQSNVACLEQTPADRCRRVHAHRCCLLIRSQSGPWLSTPVVLEAQKESAADRRYGRSLPTMTCFKYYLPVVYRAGTSAHQTESCSGNLPVQVDIQLLQV